MFVHTISTVVLAALSLSSTVLGQTAQKVGWSGVLSSMDGGLGGTVVVVDANTLMIKNYKLADGSAPALYWWGAVDDDLKSGFRISNKQITGAATSDTLTIALDAGHTTADFVTVGLWCERLKANFGQARLASTGTGGSSSTTSAASTTSATSSPTPTAKTGAGALNTASFGAVVALAVAAVFASLMA